MNCRLNFVISSILAVIAAAQDNELPQQPSPAVPTIKYEPPPPYGPHHHGSTTVCVEIKNGPSNPYAICGPQVTSGIVPPPQIYQPEYLSKDGMKMPISIQQQQSQQQQQQSIQTEPRPVVVRREMLMRPVFMPAVAPAMPQLYRSPAVYQTPSILFQKQFNPVHSPLISDGTLSMNCQFNGVKLNPDQLSVLNNNLGNKVPQNGVPHFHNTYRTPLVNVDRNLLWNYDGNSFQDMVPSSFQDTSLAPFEMSGRDVTGNEHLFDSNLWRSQPDDEFSINTSKMEEDNKKKLYELKKQIASLHEMPHTFHAKATQTEPQHSIQNQTQQIHQQSHQSVQSSNEQKRKQQVRSQKS